MAILLAEHKYQMLNTIICRAVKITQGLKEKCGPKVKDFKALLDKEVPSEVTQLKKDVEDFATAFPTIGFEKSDMKYSDWERRH